MFEFVHKKHYKAGQKSRNIVITYSFLDIMSGLLLLVLVAFYIHNYLKTNLWQTSCTAPTGFYSATQIPPVSPALNKKLK